jgi:hypothetical protein
VDHLGIAGRALKKRSCIFESAGTLVVYSAGFLISQDCPAGGLPSDLCLREG